MPTFESFILSAPSGFVRGCGALAKMEVGDFGALLEDTLAKQRAGQDVGNKSDSVKSLIYIIRSRAQAAPKPSSAEFASALDGNTVLNREIIASLATSLEASDAIQAVSQLVCCVL
jgi:hypothetical protein